MRLAMSDKAGNIDALTEKKLTPLEIKMVAKVYGALGELVSELDDDEFKEIITDQIASLKNMRDNFVYNINAILEIMETQK